MKFGYTIVFVEDVVKTVQFYEEAFGLTKRSFRDMGQFQYAEMETGETTLAFSSNSEAQMIFPAGFRENDPADVPAAILISFVTPDVEAAYAASVQAGATGLTEPHTEPWGQTVSRVRDLNGVLVSIVSPL